MRVLVVEDEPRLAALLKRGLAGEGYAVDVVGDGEEGLWMATENDYDVVVLDVMLPGRDGLDVCRTLRQRERWAPVLLLTARDATEDRIGGLDAGADDYLVKPFAFGELTARLRALTRRGQVARPAVVTVGDLELDPATRQVTRAGTAIDLSAKEFSLLELFMRNAGQVLTRTDLLERAWDFAFDPTSNIVDQYVAYLRRKIDRPFDRNDLVTIRGVGYRLDASTGTAG